MTKCAQVPGSSAELRVGRVRTRTCSTRRERLVRGVVLDDHLRVEHARVDAVVALARRRPSPPCARRRTESASRRCAASRASERERERERSRPTGIAGLPTSLDVPTARGTSFANGRPGSARRISPPSRGSSTEQLLGVALLVQEVGAEHEIPRRRSRQRRGLVPAHALRAQLDAVARRVRRAGARPRPRPSRSRARRRRGARQRATAARARRRARARGCRVSSSVATCSRERDAARPELRPVRQELLVVERRLVDQLVRARRPQQRQRGTGQFERFLDLHSDSVTDMRYRQLGSSDLQVSEICLGSWLTYGGGVDDAHAEACVAKAFDVGINFIDTANVYANGKAEEFLGEVLARAAPRLVRPRDEAVREDARRRRGTVARAGAQADRQVARSGCAPTTSTSTSAIATTGTRRSRRRWRR